MQTRNGVATASRREQSCGRNCWPPFRIGCQRHERYTHASDCNAGTSLGRKSLGELGTFSNLRAFPVKDIDRYRDHESHASKNGGGPFELVFGTDILVNWDLVSRPSCPPGCRAGAYMERSTWRLLRRGSHERGRCHRWRMPRMVRSWQSCSQLSPCRWRTAENISLFTAIKQPHSLPG